MKKSSALTFLAFAVAALATPGAASAATYFPAGPQTNVALSTVTNGGWTLCYSGTMGTAFGSSASAALAGCTGDQILLAGRATGSDTLLALAAASKVDALFDTGNNFDVTHLANGTAWYNHDSAAWGFAPSGATVNKFTCDVNAGAGRICLHTLDVGGYRINDILGLNNSSGYEKLVFTSNSTPAVPEPASWAMMILGMGAVGGALRRRSKVSTTVKFA